MRYQKSNKYEKSNLKIGELSIIKLIIKYNLKIEELSIIKLIII
jgi:hypothetical protein